MTSSSIRRCRAWSERFRSWPWERGAIYNWNDVIEQGGSFRGAQQTFTSIQNTRLVGRGSAPDLRLQARDRE
jgi:hypothetical protein